MYAVMSTLGRVLAGRQPHGFQFLQPLEAVADGAVVGERAAQPALADVGHAAAGGLASRWLPWPAAWCRRTATRLPLAGDLGEVAVRPQQAADGLAQVDDVDQVALAVDVRPHLRVPAAGAMPEVDAGLDKVLDLDDRHALPPAPRLAYRMITKVRHLYVPSARSAEGEVDIVSPGQGVVKGKSSAGDGPLGRSLSQQAERRGRRDRLPPTRAAAANSRSNATAAGDLIHPRTWIARRLRSSSAVSGTSNRRRSRLARRACSTSALRSTPAGRRLSEAAQRTQSVLGLLTLVEIVRGQVGDQPSDVARIDNFVGTQAGLEVRGRPAPVRHAAPARAG